MRSDVERKEVGWNLEKLKYPNKNIKFYLKNINLEKNNISRIPITIDSKYNVVISYTHSQNPGQVRTPSPDWGARWY